MSSSSSTSPDIVLEMLLEILAIPEEQLIDSLQFIAKREKGLKASLAKQFLSLLEEKKN